MLEVNLKKANSVQNFQTLYCWLIGLYYFTDSLKSYQLKSVRPIHKLAKCSSIKPSIDGATVISAQDIDSCNRHVIVHSQ